jgi:aryl-alcohol dehydrogenase-like predicted oxidoreductase
MQYRAFGKTGVLVSILGFGAGNLGDPAFSEDQVGRLLNEVVDLGINLIDTARSYGLSEERIGRHLALRRKEVILSTKIGYGIPGYQDWTGPCITAGIEAALQRFQTDWIDIVHLHSCPLEILRQDEILAVLQDAQSQGKIRLAAYSGENEALQWAIESGRFGSVQTSVNVCEQRVLDGGIPEAIARNIGVIAKRPLANAPWRSDIPPQHDQAAQSYWHRWRVMKTDLHGIDPEEFALRFVSSLSGVHTSLVGTGNIAHLKADVRSVEKGPLPQEFVAETRAAFRSHDRDWIGQI